VAVASAGPNTNHLHLATDNHASTSTPSFFTGRMPFLPPNQQRQSTEGKSIKGKFCQQKPEKTKMLVQWYLLSHNNRISFESCKTNTATHPMYSQPHQLLFKICINANENCISEAKVRL